jgi:hypothetical protein
VRPRTVNPIHPFPSYLTLQQSMAHIRNATCAGRILFPMSAYYVYGCARRVAREKTARISAGRELYHQGTVVP